MQVNVAAGIPALYRGESRAEIIWEGDDIDASCRSAPMLDAPLMIDAFFLAAWTGMRLGDLVAVAFDECQGSDATVRKAAKRSRGRRRGAVVPILPQCAELMEELRLRPRKEKVNTLLVNSHGAPWSTRGPGDCFAEVRDHAKLIHHGSHGEPDTPKPLHDLRGTFVAALCRAGLTDDEIANIVAWSSQIVAEIRRPYVDDAAVVVALKRRIRAHR